MPRKMSNLVRSNTNNVFWFYVAASVFVPAANPRDSPMLIKDAVQRSCCLYLACERTFRGKVPDSFFVKEMPEIRKAWPRHRLVSCSLQFARQRH